MDLFRIAEQNGLVVEKVLEKLMDRVLFDRDPGISLYDGHLIRILTNRKTG